MSIKEIFISRALVVPLFSGVETFLGIGYLEEQFCEINLNLEQWFRRSCRLKIFLFRALEAHWFSGAEPFVLFWYKAS